MRPEHKAAISVAMLGNQNGRGKSHPCSDETRAKISAALQGRTKGVPKSTTHKAAISAALTGMKKTAEAVAAMRVAGMNRAPTKARGPVGPCDICGGNQKPGAALAKDHDHVTGKTRGRLCHNCNLVLGHAKDNPKILRDAADYLERYA